MCVDHSRGPFRWWWLDSRGLLRFVGFCFCFFFFFFFGCTIFQLFWDLGLEKLIFLVLVLESIKITSEAGNFYAAISFTLQNLCLVTCMCPQLPSCIIVIDIMLLCSFYICVLLLVYKTQPNQVALIFFINLFTVKFRYNEWWWWNDMKCTVHYTNRPTWRHQHGFISSSDWLASPRWRLCEAAWILMKPGAKTGS